MAEGSGGVSGRLRDLGRKAAAVLLGLGIALLGVEGAIRVRRLFRPSGAAVGTIVLDEELGWRATPGYSREREERDASGNVRRVSVRFDAAGLRRVPPPASPTGARVLFVGDSFTQAVEVSDDETFYAVLSARDGIEARACGTGGYGTLQELLALERCLDAGVPDAGIADAGIADAVVLQFSSNDFINNSLELERRSTDNNNGMKRPYLLDDGRIVRVMPKPFPLLRDVANRYLRSVYFVLSRLDRLAAGSSSVEGEIARVGPSFPPFAEASRTTKRLLERMRERVGPARKLYAFCVDETPPFTAEFRRVAAEAGLAVIEGVPEAVREAEAAGMRVRVEDGAHWNAVGHRIAAEALRRGIGAWPRRSAERPAGNLPGRD